MFYRDLNEKLVEVLDALKRITVRHRSTLELHEPSWLTHSDAFSRVHYALAMAAAAAAIDRPATLFFTMGAIRALVASNGAGNPGWHGLGGDAAARDRDLAAAGIGDFETLLEACTDLGVRIMVCEAGLRAEGLSRADLRPDVHIEDGGLATLLLETGDAARIVFV